MTASILTFPAPMQPDRRALIVAAADAILRSPAPHDEDTIRAACNALMEWGDPATDWWRGYHVLRALDAKPAHVVKRPDYSPQPRIIRAALVDSAILAAFGAVVLIVMLAL